MAKKKPTATQRKNRLRAAQYSLKGGEFASIIAPFVIMGCANADEWFIENPENGWKIGLGGALAMALLGIAVWLATAKNEKDSKLTNGWITLVVGWFCIAFIFVLLGSIVDQIANIMLWGGIGILGAAGLDIASLKVKAKADGIKKAIDEAGLEVIKEKERRRIMEEEGSLPTE